MEQFFRKLPKWAITTLSCCVSVFIIALTCVCFALAWGILQGALVETPYFKVTPQQLYKLNDTANQLSSSIKELELSQQHLNKLFGNLNLDKSSWSKFVTGATNPQAILNWEAGAKEIPQILEKQKQLLREQQMEIDAFNKNINEINRKP